jgi:hypothetical protein
MPNTYSHEALLLWGGTYFLPALCTAFLILVLPQRKNTPAMRALLLHGGVLLSLLLIHREIADSGLLFPFAPQTHSGVLFLFTIIITWHLHEVHGLLYALSAFLQQLCLVSIAFLLVPLLTLPAILLLVVLPYAVSHLLERQRATYKFILTLLWGCTSILVFVITEDVYLVTTLHTLLGLTLLRPSILAWTQGLISTP